MSKEVSLGLFTVLWNARFLEGCEVFVDRRGHEAVEQVRDAAGVGDVLVGYVDKWAQSRNGADELVQQACVVGAGGPSDGKHGGVLDLGDGMPFKASSSRVRRAASRKKSLTAFMESLVVSVVR